MYYVYVLKSRKDGKNYTGMTTDLNRRIVEHNRGRINTPSTRYRGPFELIYQEKVQDRGAAREKEKFLKSGAGREFLRNKFI